MKKVIVLGSARKQGNTEEAAKKLITDPGWELIDLNNYSFSYYDYNHRNRNDDFIPLVNKISKDYNTIVFATPVYWYSMSGIMKVFFDRLTDLITIEKALGRRMRGMKMAVLTTSNGSNLGDLFWQPFIHTAEYLGMEYLGNVHLVNEEEHDKHLESFRKILTEPGIKKAKPLPLL